MPMAPAGRPGQPGNAGSQSASLRRRAMQCNGQDGEIFTAEAQRSRWPQPKMGYRTPRPLAGEGAWGVAHALSRRCAPTSPTSWARCTVCAHRHSPQPAKMSEVNSTEDAEQARFCLKPIPRLLSVLCASAVKIPQSEKRTAPTDGLPDQIAERAPRDPVASAMPACRDSRTPRSLRPGA
jgi:hypothetical protein